MGETYAEVAAREVLTAPDTGVHTVVGHAALVLACVGEVGESDRLVRHWKSRTERSVSRLIAGPVPARAWEMLFHARGGRPEWAEELVPLDLDAEEQAHREYLARSAGPLCALAAEADSRARDGDIAGAEEAVTEWAERARKSVRPDLAMLAACRHLAPLLVQGALATPPDWAAEYAGLLIAALQERYQPARETYSWPELIDEIMRLRGMVGAVPPPTTQAGIADAERRLGQTLPEEYCRFLLTCDGLPADVVFPRLLGTAEIEATGPGIRISEPDSCLLHAETGAVVESDPLFGRTVHPGIRALLEEHRRLLEATL